MVALLRISQVYWKIVVSIPVDAKLCVRACVALHPFAFRSCSRSVVEDMPSLHIVAARLAIR